MVRRKVDHAATTAARARAGTARFCSRCGVGERSEAARPGAPTRICQRCEDGLLLACAREALPGPGTAFMIVTSALRISAVSEAAESLFGAERQLLCSSLGDLIASPTGGEEIVRTVAAAALRNRESVVLPVRGRAKSARGAEMLARISTCGPPRAALVTLTWGQAASGVTEGRWRARKPGAPPASGENPAGTGKRAAPSEGPKDTMACYR